MYNIPSDWRQIEISCLLFGGCAANIFHSIAFSTGPVELQVNVQQHDHSQMVLSVDLGSVYKTEDRNAVYRLEKADVLERNKWELIIMVGFHAGVVTTVKSKPFRITTRATQKSKSPELPLEKSSK